jgi:hypothetical protein
MQVALSSAPVCSGTACEKRQRTIYYDTLDTNALEPELWLLTHEEGRVLPCWENTITNAASFREPTASVWEHMTLPFALCLIFFAVAFLLIATFLKPKSVFGRALHNLGIQKKVQGDVEQGRTLTRLSSTRSRSDDGGDGEDNALGRSNSEPARAQRALSSSYQDLQSAGIVMDFEPAAVGFSGRPDPTLQRCPARNVCAHLRRL